MSVKAYSLSVRKGTGSVEGRFLCVWHHDGANELVAIGEPGNVVTYTLNGQSLPERVRASITKRIHNGKCGAWSMKSETKRETNRRSSK